MPDSCFNRDRPYNGQLHTFVGERGAYKLTPYLTIRDVYDAVQIGIARAAGVDDETIQSPTFDVWRLDLDRVDPVAVAQNACCEIEKRLGIFPNIPKISDHPSYNETEDPTDDFAQEETWAGEDGM